MKKIALSLITLLALAGGAFAGQEIRDDGKDSKTIVADPCCFKAGELKLDLFGSLDTSDRGWGGGGGIGLTYFPIRFVGVGVECDAWSAHTGVINPNGNVYFRLPLQVAGHCFAPYLFGGAGYLQGSANGGSGVFGSTSIGNEHTHGAEGHVGAGIEICLTERIGIFFDYRHGWGEDIDYGTVRGGLSIGFY